MSGAARVEVKGLREFQRDMRRASKDVAKEFTKTMVELGAPIAADARSRADRYGSAVSNKIRPRVKGASLFLESRARSKGIRPDFGALVMGQALIPAVEGHADEVVDGFSKAVDELWN